MPLGGCATNVDTHAASHGRQPAHLTAASRAWLSRAPAPAPIALLLLPRSCCCCCCCCCCCTCSRRSLLTWRAAALMSASAAVEGARGGNWRRCTCQGECCYFNFPSGAGRQRGKRWQPMPAPAGCLLACVAQAGQHLLQQRRGVGQQLLGRQLHQGVQPPERGELRRRVVSPLLQLLRQDEGDLADVCRAAAAAAGLNLQQKLLQGRGPAGGDGRQWAAGRARVCQRSV